jgi:hypothetical protein
MISIVRLENIDDRVFINIKKDISFVFLRFL